MQSLRRVNASYNMEEDDEVAKVMGRNLGLNKTIDVRRSSQPETNTLRDGPDQA